MNKKSLGIDTTQNPLRKIRKFLKITLAEASIKLGIKLDFLQRIESGQRPLPQNVIVMLIFSVLEADIDYEKSSIYKRCIDWNKRLKDKKKIVKKIKT